MFSSSLNAGKKHERKRIRDVPPSTVILGIVALVVIPRVLLFVTGLAAAAESSDAGLGDLAHSLWLNPAADPGHYLRIADVGYRSSGEDALFIVFFPLFPLLVAGTGFVVRNLVVASLLVTTTASIASGWLLYRLVRLDRPEAEARGSVVLLFAFPTAYALFAPYSEAVFLTAVLGSVYAARTGRWGLAGLAGLAATGTRLVGLALVPALLVEAFVAQRGTGNPLRKLASVALVPLGFVSYLAINHVVHGDPLHFLEVQEAHWFQHRVWPWEPVTDAIEAIRSSELTFESLFVHPARLAAIAFGLGVLAWGWRSLGWTDRAFSATTMLMVLSAAWLISLPRYLLAVYPLFTTMGGLGRRPRVLWTVAALVFGLQLFLFGRFARGMWAF